VYASQPTNSYAQPDFAYPTKVAANARTMLAGALKANNGQLALRALMNLSISLTDIDLDSAATVIADCRRASATLSRPADCALVDLLTAKIYYTLYNYNQWTYDRREQSAEPSTSDFKLWNGTQWRDTIRSFVDSAIANPDVLAATSCAAYANVLSIDAKSAPMYATLLDFVALQSVDILNNIGDDTRLPDIYATWIDHAKASAPELIAAEVSRLKFLADKHGARSASTAEGKKTYADLLALWSEQKASPYAAEALIAAYPCIDRNTPIATVRSYVAACDEQVAAHADYFRNDCLLGYVDHLKQPVVSVNYPTMAVPGDSLQLDIDVRNARDFTINIYAVPYTWSETSWRYELTKKNISALKLAECVDVTVDSVAPFRASIVRRVALPEAGTYIIAPAFPGKLPETGSYTYLHCSNVRLGSLTFKSSAIPFAINSATGQPLSGVTLSGYTNARQFKLVDSKTTDADGMAQMNSDVRTIFAQRGDDRYAAPLSLSAYYSAQTQKYVVTAHTALALYHPGDTVDWVAVIQSVTGAKSVPQPSTEVCATLYDANHQIIDSAKVTTDAFGRVAGRFPLPSEGLTGSYALRFALTDAALQKSMRWNDTYFTVSDYKLPTYHVDVVDIMRDTPVKGSVTIEGCATTYSGFPVADAAVTVDLLAGEHSWWSNPKSFAALADTTRADGTFTIVCSASLLDSALVGNAIFRANISVTSSAGETQAASASFTLGKPLMLRATIANSNVDATKLMQLNIDLATVNGVQRVEPLDYKILGADSAVVAAGTFRSDAPTIDVATLPSGVYSLCIVPSDTTLADGVTIDRLVVYRASDSASPDADELLWLPNTTQTISATSGIDVLYATSAPETWIVYALTSGDKLIDKGWIKVASGMHRFTHTLSADCASATLQLASVQGYKQANRQVTFTRENVVQALDISIESFRNRIVPGNTEQWTLRVKERYAGESVNAKKSGGVRSAVILDIYNKALDALAAHSFGLSANTQSYPRVVLNIGNGLRTNNRSVSLPVARRECLSLPEPAYITWDYPLVSVGTSSRGKMFHRSKLMSVASMEAKATNFAAGSFATDDRAVTDEVAVLDSGAVEAETVEIYDADNFAYRDSATPLALFAPMLTTDVDGTLRVDFTAPNANATWVLKALAYGADMSIGNASRTMIAAKPVMVQPNLPRFLRNGDRATVKATVMNNSDTIAHVTTHVELFDPVTGTTLQAHDYVAEVVPTASAIVATDIEAPADATMLGYRVKVSAGSYADGEQTIIPILAASQPVVESTPFYIPADTLRYSITLPEIADDARVTLQFCENPAWYVATSLPGIRAEKSQSALSATAAIFSAAVADGLLRDQPEIADALRLWTASDRSDSTLTSMLLRNADLKIALFNATPWIADASSQTERMSRLALLFDRAEINSTYADAIALLSKLQAPDGGLAWMSLNSESSLWATENVLVMLGRLKQLGWLPDSKELANLMSRALAYVDSSVAANARRNSKLTDSLYLYLRTFYPETAQIGECVAVTSRTLADIRKSWRKYTVGEKAVAAIILKQNGDVATARQITSSLRDYAVSSPERGTWWPALDRQSWWSMGRVGTTALILDAFVSVDSSVPEIDGIRQWLILQKKANDWGTSVATSQAIASILTTGTKWTRPASPVSITISGKAVEPTAVESLLGEMRSDISSLNPSGATLAVGKSQAGPSWGAVVSRYVGTMSDIKADACDDLSIEKAVYRRVVSPSDEVIGEGGAPSSAVTWSLTDTLRVGDMVKVDLTIRAARDLQYVAIVDNRAACLEPVDQLSTSLWSEGLRFYRENRDDVTNIFVTRMPKGTYRLSYTFTVNNVGTFSSGLASVQSQYAPAVSAHSSGCRLLVLPN
jgi:5-hydroxyisourate hydrolase-like protein (transthyretin family)